MNKYLSENPLPWLLEEKDPHVRYLTLRDIYEGENKEELLNAEYKRLKETAYSLMLDKKLLGGVLGDKDNFDVFHKGSIWHFAEAVEHGFCRDDPRIEDTAEYILQRCQLKSGGFTFNWKPETEVACRAGDMIRHLIQAGFMDNRIEMGIQWIKKNQRYDGGWLYCPVSGLCDTLGFLLLNRPGRGLKYEGAGNVDSCIYASIACGLALVKYSGHKEKFSVKGESDPGIDKCIKEAAQYFLRRRLFKDINRKNRLRGFKNCGTGDFNLLGYPLLSQYDISQGLGFITSAGFFEDPRAGEAFNIIMSKQNNDGTWNLENTRPGMLVGIKKKKAGVGKKNKWVTLNVLRFLKTAGLFSRDHK